MVVQRILLQHWRPTFLSILRDTISETMMVIDLSQTLNCHPNHTLVNINMVHFGQNQQKMYFVINERNYSCPGGDS